MSIHRSLSPRRHRLSRLLVGLLFAILGLTGQASAHPADEAAVYHYLWVEAKPRELSLQYAASVGGLVTQAVWSQIDADASGEIAPAEQQRHAGQLAADLPLRIDGKPVRWKVEEALYPSRDQFFRANSIEAAIRLRLSTPLPPLGKTGRLAGLRDETFPLYTGIFPRPVVRDAGEPLVTENGRAVEFRLGSGRSSSSSSSSSSGGDRGRGRGRAEPSNAPSVRGLDIDIEKAPLFPDGLRVSVPPRGEGEHAGELKGFLGRPLSLPLVLLGLGAALLAGAAHALTPGHGKTMVAAYLVGERGTVWHAVLLGLVVTITHTSSVYVLGFLCLWLTSRIDPDRVGTWLNVVSGLLVLGMGFWLLQRALLAYHGIRPLPGHTHGPDGHSHGEAPYESSHQHACGPEHAHAHAGGAGHSHVGEQAMDESRRPPSDSPLEEGPAPGPAGRVRPASSGLAGVVGLGIAGGLVPCTDGLAILIAAVNLGSVAIGMAIIAAFSAGMAAVLVAVGILMVRARSLMERFTGESRVMKSLPVASAAVLFLLGAWLTFQSLARAGVLRLG